MVCVGGGGGCFGVFCAVYFRWRGGYIGRRLRAVVDVKIRVGILG